MPSLTATLAVRLIDGITGPAGKAAKSLKGVEQATAQLGKIKSFREQTARLDGMVSAHAKARESIRGLAAQLIAAESPSKKLQESYQRATAAADKMSGRIETQRARVRGAAQAVEGMGVSVRNLAGAQAVLRASIDRTTTAMRRQEEIARRKTLAKPVVGGAIAGAGIRVSNAGRNVAVKAVEEAGSLDIAQKKQLKFAEITQEAQDRLLKPQAKKIAFDTQFSTKDVTQAQTAVMAGLPNNLDKAGVAVGITESAKNFAMSMGSTMTEAAEAARAYMAARQADMTTPDAAMSSARRATNMMIRASKLGGSSHEDISGFVKYGMPSARAAGISENNTLAMQIALRRAGIRGDEAGVAVRSIAGKLVAPTNKGRAAMLAAGIDYDKFTTMPGGMSTGNLEKTLKSQLGLKLNDATRKAIEEVHANPELTTDRGDYAAAIREALEENSGKSMSAKDSEAVARAASQFHKLSVESVDTNALLEAIMAANLTLAQANAIFTDKQGSRASLAFGKPGDFDADRKALDATPDDYGSKIAEYIMSGLGGSLERFKGAVEATVLAIGEANSGLARFTLDGVGGALDKFSNLSTTSQQAATALGALAAGGTAVYGTVKVLSGLKALLTGGASATALSASALALDGSAAALTAAAAKLAGGSVPTPAGKVGGDAVKKVGVGGLLGRAGAVGAAIGAAILATQPIREANEKRFEGVSPGEAHNQGQAKRRASNEAIRQQFLEQRRQLGIVTDAGAAAGAEAGSRVGAGIAEALTGKRGDIVASAQSTLSIIKAIFGAGIDVPVRAQLFAPTPGAPKTMPSGDKVSSIGRINNTVHVTTGSVNPNEIAQVVSRKLAEATQSSLRSNFADGVG